MRRLKLLVRKNLKMSPGKIAAQCVHAALGLQYQLQARIFTAIYSLDYLMSVIVLEVSDAKFEEAKKTLALASDPFHVVQDAGYTEVPAGTETALAFLEDDPREVNVVKQGENNA